MLFYFFQQEADHVNRSYDMGCGHAGGFIYAGRNLKKYKNILKIYFLNSFVIGVEVYRVCQGIWTKLREMIIFKSFLITIEAISIF